MGTKATLQYLSFCKISVHSAQQHHHSPEIETRVGSYVKAIKGIDIIDTKSEANGPPLRMFEMNVDMARQKGMSEMPNDSSSRNISTGED